MQRPPKLELTWIGKENRPRLEPRIFLEEAGKSYHAAKRMAANDLFDNRLIRGDNLLALKALEAEFSGKIKCVYIDPPYNTGSAFTHYEDGVEHSLWLSLMQTGSRFFGSCWRVMACSSARWTQQSSSTRAFSSMRCLVVQIGSRPSFGKRVTGVERSLITL